MKKVLLTFAFIFGVASLNANTTNLETDCHAQACEIVVFTEEFMGELSEAEAQAAYDIGYQECKNNN